MFLVVPHRLVLFQLLLVQLVELCEWSRPVYLLPLFVVFLGVVLAQLDMGLRWLLLLYFGVGDNVDAVGVEFGGLDVLGLAAGLGE